MSVGLKLLSSLCRQGSTSALRDLTSDMFVGDDEQRMYNYVRTHYRRYSELPALQTIATDLQINIPNARETTQYYIDEARKRGFYNAVTPLYNDMHRPLVDGDIEEVQTIISQMHGETRTHAPDRNDQSLSDVVQRASGIVIDRRNIGGLSGVPTGWPTLDLETDGYQNGDLIVWAARPGIGKTHILIHQARTAFHANKSILFVSMEMTLEQIAMRMMAHEAGMDPNLIRRGQISNYCMGMFEEARDRLLRSDQFHMYSGNLSRSTEEIDATVQETGADLIFIDGLYLMKPKKSTARQSKDKYQNISYVLDDLKEMTLVRDRPFIATTQMNRQGKGKPSLETLGFTDALATHASVIVGVQGQGAGKHPPERLITFLKGREGEAGDFVINYRFAPLNFREVMTNEQLAQQVDQEQDPEEGWQE